LKYCPGKCPNSMFDPALGIDVKFSTAIYFPV